MASEAEINEQINMIMDDLDTKLEQQDVQLKKKERARFEAAIKEIIHGKKPKDAFGMSDKEIENMYAFGYNLFTHGKYNDSQLMMRHLMSLDPDDYRYPLACAAAYHQMKDYERAAPFYINASKLNPETPLPHYYLYDCFKNLNEPLSALLMLDNVIARCGDNPNHAVLKERTTRMRASLDKEIEESGIMKKFA